MRASSPHLVVGSATADGQHHRPHQHSLAFFNTRERPRADGGERLGLRVLFTTLARNRPLLLVLAGSVLGFGRHIVQAGGAVFVVTAYGDRVCSP